MIRGRVGGRVVVGVVGVNAVVGREPTPVVLARLVTRLVAASAVVVLASASGSDVRRLRTLASTASPSGQTAVVGDGGAVHRL